MIDDSAKRCRFRFSLQKLFAAVTLAAVGTAAIVWSANEAMPWSIGIATFVCGMVCACGAIGVLFGRGRQVAKIGGAIALGFSLWVTWENYILSLEDVDKIRYWPSNVPMLWAFVLGRMCAVVGLTSAFCFGVNLLCRSIVKRSKRA